MGVHFFQALYTLGNSPPVPLTMVPGGGSGPGGESDDSAATIGASESRTDVAAATLNPQFAMLRTNPR